MCQRHVWETLKNSQYACVLPCGVCPTFVAWLVGMGATQTKSMVNKMLWARVSTCLKTPNCARLAPILAKSKAKGPKWSPMGGGAGPIACNAN